MPPDNRPITKRFPGQHCTRTTIWFPDKERPGKHSFRMGFEGRLDPTIAEAIVALLLHQSDVAPEMAEQLKAMTASLNKKKP